MYVYVYDIKRPLFYCRSRSKKKIKDGPYSSLAAIGSWWALGRAAPSIPVETEPSFLLHAQVFCVHSLRQRPIKAVQQVGLAELDDGRAHGDCRARLPARAERQQLKMLPSEIDAAVLEPFRVELSILKSENFTEARRSSRIRSL